MKRKALAIALTAAMAMGLVSSVPVMAEEEQVTIKVFSNLPDRTSGQGLIEQTLFDMYMEENPNVTIEVEALDDESYKTKFKAYASGSSMPDLVNVWGQPAFISEVIDAGLLAELNEEDYADYNFLDGSLNGFSQDGKLYGLARNTDVMGFYYNKAIFEECGVEVPTTWDELIGAVQTITDAGYIAISMDGSDKYPIAILIEDIYQKIAGSADTYSNAAAAVESGSYDESWTQAAQMVVDLVEAGGFQTGFETTDYGTALNLFTNGQAAMYYMGSWEMSMATNEDIDEETRNNISVFTMPLVDGGTGTATEICAWNGGGYSVTANSEVKDEAIALLNYMFEPDHWSKLAWENGVCMSAQNFSDYLTGEETSLQLEWIDIVSGSTSVSGTPINDLGTSEFKTVCEDSCVELAIGSLSVDEFYSALAAFAQ
ncbi:MAG: extracellular solute-binding protein [Lachnospiraceae bacterium]|nr:extracellular solute-binding protein [Lachnospiraceae bacterium]